jgi:hypothetical protein
VGGTFLKKVGYTFLVIRTWDTEFQFRVSDS